MLFYCLNNALFILNFVESLVPYERFKVADALEPVLFNDGDVIIREGDTDGDKFYIVEKVRVLISCCTAAGRGKI